MDNCNLCGCDFDGPHAMDPSGECVHESMTECVQALRDARDKLTNYAANVFEVHYVEQEARIATLDAQVASAEAVIWQVGHTSPRTVKGVRDAAHAYFKGRTPKAIAAMQHKIATLERDLAAAQAEVVEARNERDMANEYIGRARDHINKQLGIRTVFFDDLIILAVNYALEADDRTRETQKTCDEIQAERDALELDVSVMQDGSEALEVARISLAAREASWLEQNAALRDLWALSNGDIGAAMRRASIERQSPAVCGRRPGSLSALEAMLTKACAEAWSRGVDAGVALENRGDDTEQAPVVAAIVRRILGKEAAR